jgi:hypothetical protein
MKLSNIGFDELCNILEKKYVSYRNKQLEIADNLVFAVNPPSNSKLDHSCYIFLVVYRFNKEISIYDPDHTSMLDSVYGLVEEPYFGRSTHNIHLADVSDQEDIINSVISKIDNNLKTYHDMKKQFLKNKMDKL